MEVLRFGYRIPFLCDPPLSKVPISMPGACSTSFPRLLQPSICSVEDLRVLETRHRSLDPQSLLGRVTFPDGDHPVSSPVLFVRATGWPPSISRKLTCRSLSIRILVASFGLWHRAECTSSLLFALASPRLRRSSPGSWLLFPPFSILGVSA